MTLRDRIRLTLTLAGKDWRLFWADRRAAALCFLVPVVLASAFGLLFDRPPEAEVRLPLLVVSAADSPFAGRVVADLLASPRVDAKAVTLAEAERLVADRRPGVAVVITPAFDALADWRPGSDSRPAVPVLHHPLCRAEGQWAEGVVTEVVMRRLAHDRLGAYAAAADPPFRTDPIPVSGGDRASFNAYSHSFCGMTLQYLLFWGMESGLLLLRERQRGVWLRLRAAPVPLWAVLLGRAVTTAGIALLQVLGTFAFGYVAFGVTVAGSFVGFVLLALAAAGLSAATGLLVAAVGGTEARGRSVAILVILAVSMAGGLWLPAFLLPGWARDLALALPTSWAMRGLEGVTWQGRGLAATLPTAAAVAGFAAVFLAVAVARLAASEARRRRGWGTA
jgi:ABC-2 type transport system permease protein